MSWSALSYLGGDVNLALLLDIEDHLLQVLGIEFFFLNDLLEILRKSLKVEVLLAKAVKILGGDLQLVLEVVLILNGLEQLLVRELELSADVLLNQEDLLQLFRVRAEIGIFLESHYKFRIT